MSAHLSFAMLGLIGFCILTEAARELCFKQAANASSLPKILVEPIVWLGIGFWAIELVAWTNTLEHVPLSLAYPLMSLSYVTILLAGALVFRERVNKRHAIGALLITAGAACVGATGI